jgi:hypothetical protein
MTLILIQIGIKAPETLSNRLGISCTINIHRLDSACENNLVLVHLLHRN